MNPFAAPYIPGPDEEDEVGSGVWDSALPVAASQQQQPRAGPACDAASDDAARVEAAWAEEAALAKAAAAKPAATSVSSTGRGGDAADDIPLCVYHEKQLSALCGVHALNNLLQGPYFGAGDLAELGASLKEQVAQEMGPEASLEPRGRLSGRDGLVSGQRREEFWDDVTGDFSIELLQAITSGAHRTQHIDRARISHGTRGHVSHATVRTRRAGCARAARLASGQRGVRGGGRPRVTLAAARGGIPLSHTRALVSDAPWLPPGQQRGDHTPFARRRYVLRPVRGLWFNLDSRLRRPRLLADEDLARLIGEFRADRRATLHVLERARGAIGEGGGDGDGGLPPPAPPFAGAVGREDLWHPIEYLLDPTEGALLPQTLGRRLHNRCVRRDVSNRRRRRARHLNRLRQGRARGTLVL